MHVRPSVCAHLSAWLLLEGFPWSLILGTSVQICRGKKLACTFCEDLSIFIVVVVGSNVCRAKIIRMHCCFSVVLSKKGGGIPCIVETDIRTPTIQKDVGLRLILLVSAFEYHSLRYRLLSVWLIFVLSLLPQVFLHEFIFSSLLPVTFFLGYHSSFIHSFIHSCSVHNQQRRCVIHTES